MKQRDRKSWADRLKEARLKAGISQRNLGIAADIDQFVASARINRYEKGIHEPDYRTSARLAEVLRTPLAYFYAEQDDLAQIIEAYGELKPAKRRQLLAFVLQLRVDRNSD